MNNLEKIKVIQDRIDGKTIEYRYKHVNANVKNWNIMEEVHDFNFCNYKYRVKITWKVGEWVRHDDSIVGLGKIVSVNGGDLTLLTHGSLVTGNPYKIQKLVYTNSYYHNRVVESNNHAIKDKFQFSIPGSDHVRCSLGSKRRTFKGVIPPLRVIN